MQPYQNNALIPCKPITGGQSFTIFSIQWLKQHAAYENDSAQTHDHYKIIWITKGNGNCWKDVSNCPFRENDLFFVKPGQVYKLQSTEELEGYIISFTDSFLETDSQAPDLTYHSSLFNLFTTANGIQIEYEWAPELKSTTEKMIKEYNNRHLFREEMLRRYLKIIFIYLSRQLAGILQITRQTRNMSLVQQFMSLLEKHYKTEKMVAGYASLLSVTPNYLNEIIKKTTGYSAGHHIRQRVVLEAKRQATYSDHCMKQIGYYLGFDDTAHFSKFFKNAAGINFTDFKKERITVLAASR